MITTQSLIPQSTNFEHSTVPCVLLKSCVCRCILLRPLSLGKIRNNQQSSFTSPLLKTLERNILKRCILNHSLLSCIDHFKTSKEERNKKMNNNINLLQYFTSTKTTTTTVTTIIIMIHRHQRTVLQLYLLASFIINSLCYCLKYLKK